MLKELSTVSSVYRDRIEKVKSVKPRIIRLSRLNLHPHVTLSSGRYTQEILFLEKVNEDSRVKIYCSCPSFNFEFAYILNTNDILLHPRQFSIAVRKTPQMKNQNNIITGCKHCIAAAQLIQKRMDHLQDFYKE